MATERGDLKASGARAAVVPELRLYEMAPLADLIPNPRNPREHTKRQIRELARSYREFGVINPIIVDSRRRIVAGHGRYAAAQALELAEVPVLVVDGLTPAQLKAYALADNKLGDMSSFDMKLVLEEIESIQADDPAFDITATGFFTAEVDALVGATRVDRFNDLQDDPPSARATGKPIVTRAGDIWQMGRHRTICGDATSPDIIARLVDGTAVRMLLEDVPFNTKIKGFVSGLGKNCHEDFEMAAGEMTSPEFVEFLRRANAAALPHLVDGAMVLQFIDWRHVSDMLEAGARSGLSLRNILVWVKSNAGMGSLWRSQHELICAFRHGSAPHVNNVELGVHGRNRTNVLSYPGMNAPGRGRKKALELHATVKPVALIADLILDVNDRGDVLLDAFGGSGTAIVAAEKTGRIAYLAEISPAFVDGQVRRWEALASEPARPAVTGATFAEVAAERLGGGGAA